MEIKTDIVVSKEFSESKELREAIDRNTKEFLYSETKKLENKILERK